MVHLGARDAVRELTQALRRPERLAQRWNARGNAPGGVTAWVFPVFLATAIFGIAVYGLTMGMHAGAVGMLTRAVTAPLAAGLAWTLALPALFIINSALGSKLELSTALLAALITVAFGSTAMLASVPVNWFFALALPYAWARLLVNIVIFAGVGVCMVDVFIRIMRHLEPERSHWFAHVWLSLVGIIGIELFAWLDVFAL